MMRRKAGLFAALAVVALGSVSCLSRLTSEQFEQNKTRPEQFFDFNTSSLVRLNLDYGSFCARALVRIYAQDPLIQKDGESVLDESLLPLHQQFTDAQGHLEATINLPGHANGGVWIYSDAMCMPRCEFCEIDEEHIFNFREGDIVDTKAGTGVRAVSESPYAYKLTGHDGFYTIVSWTNAHAKLSDHNGIVSTGDLTSDQITAIKSAVWNGKSSKPSGLDNSAYILSSTDMINTTVRSSYQEDGKAVKVESAEVFFTFVQESGWNRNVVGYYFYPSEEVPTSPDKVKKYIILPNASISGNAPYGATGFNNTNYGTTNAPVSSNTKIQLLYEDEDGNMTPYFPPKTTIGYFIIANGWTNDGTTKVESAAATTKAGIRNCGADTKATTENITMKVGETKSVYVSGLTGITWESSNSKVASVSGLSATASIRAVAEGTATITAKKKKTRGYETLGTWNITVTGSGSGTDTPSTGESSFSGSIDFDQTILYSNLEWNSGASSFTAFNASDYVLYGIEDGGDKSYEDILFTISATPKKSVIDPFNPNTVDDDIVEEEKLTVGHRTFATYCFEDLWPSLGDYDMNDVIVEHRSSMLFDIDNDLSEVRDTFTVCNEILSSGEGVKDAFAVRIPMGERGVMDIPTGAELEDETGSIVLFENAQDNLKKSFVITRTFDKGAITLDEISTGLDIDPYIICVYPSDIEEGKTWRSDKRREVHFPKKDPTSKIDSTQMNNNYEAYFVARDNKHPFAICIPLPVAQTRAQIAQAKQDGSMFVVSSEMFSIDGQYATSGHSYAEWVESQGGEAADWYTKYKTSDSSQTERVEMNTYPLQ